MGFLNGITILLLCQLVGEVIAQYFSMPVPGPVVGMILLFLTIALKGSVSQSLDSTTSALLRHLSLLFVPAGVGMMAHFDRIAQEWLSITITLVLSTAVTMGATALVMLGASRWLVRGDENHG
jgi:holin-like protein